MSTRVLRAAAAVVLLELAVAVPLIVPAWWPAALPLALAAVLTLPPAVQR